MFRKFIIAGCGSSSAHELISSLKLIITHQEAKQGLTYAFNVLWSLSCLCTSCSCCGNLLIWSPFHEPQRLLLLAAEDEHLAHCINHVLLGRCIALRIQVLDKEGIDHSTVYHELIAINLSLDLFDELCGIALHLIAFRFKLICQLCLSFGLRL